MVVITLLTNVMNICQTHKQHKIMGGHCSNNGHLAYYFLQPPFSISDGIDGSTTLYTINYSNLTSGEVCGSAMIPGSSCMDSVCSDVFNVTSSRCFPSTELSVTIFASNILGNGEISEAYTYG